eukprot:m.101918 g.101918  ORF g.101918 m.101918 type:complete len:431 (+) comp10412_c0_seq1:80-1372(+)
MMATRRRVSLYGVILAGLVGSHSVLGQSGSSPDCDSPSTQTACEAVRDSSNLRACMWTTETNEGCLPSGGDPCPSITNENTCRSNSNCQWTGSCILGGPCFQGTSQGSCEGTTGCTWTNITSNYCQTFNVNCGDITSQSTCNTQRDQTNNQACMWASISSGECEPYSPCLDGAASSTACSRISGCSWSFGTCALTSPPAGAGSQNCDTDASFNEFDATTCNQGPRAGTNVSQSCQWVTTNASFCASFDACSTLTTQSACRANASCTWAPSSSSAFDCISTTSVVTTAAPMCFAVTDEVSCGQTGCSWVNSTTTTCSSVCQGLTSSAACSGNGACTWDTTFGAGACVETTPTCSSLNASSCSAQSQCTSTSTTVGDCRQFSVCYQQATQSACTAQQNCDWFDSCIPGDAPTTTVPPAPRCSDMTSQIPARV